MHACEGIGAEDSGMHRSNRGKTHQEEKKENTPYKTIFAAQGDN